MIYWLALLTALTLPWIVGPGVAILFYIFALALLLVAHHARYR